MNDLIKFATEHNFRVKWQPGDWPLFGGRCKARLESDGTINVLDVLNGTPKGAEEILWCMAAAYLHHDKGNTIISEERNKLDKEAERATRLAMDLYGFMKRKAKVLETKSESERQLPGRGVLLPFPTGRIYSE